jgi:hypothetical protein
VTTEAVLTTLGVGRVEYGALRRHGNLVLTVAWRYRVSRAGRWFTCGELVPDGRTFAIRGWDGQPIGQAGSVRDGLEAVRRYYATMAIGSAEPADSLRY